ncbi:MAG: hypothetical protein ACQEV7_10360 [Bacillota bacterium]
MYSKYSNVFYYYRGQSEGSAVPLKQNENNTKKAFINLLQHSDPLLTINFIKEYTGQDLSGDTFVYDYETTTKLRATQLGYAFAISESTAYVDTFDNIDSNRRPDATIQSENIGIVFEFKILGGKLNPKQIKGHMEYLNSKLVFEPIRIEWRKIREFLKKQYDFFLNQNKQLTCFLLKQFDEFCNFNSVGLVPLSNEYFYSRFSTEKAQMIAKQINDYLFYECDYRNDIVDSHLSAGKPRTDCIGYKSKSKPNKVFTITEKRNVCFVLHLGKKHQNMRGDIQNEINKELGMDLIRDKIGEPTKTEAYIKLELANSFEQIKPYIDKVYRLRILN